MKERFNMKKFLVILAATVIAASAYAQNTVTYTNRGEVITVNTMENAVMGGTGTPDTSIALAANALDAKAPGTLKLGESVATKVEIADAGVETEVQGTLDVHQAATFASTVAITGVATLTAAPKLTSTNTAGAITLTMTNAPTLADAGKAVPIYLNVTVGTNTYVVPAWPLAAE